MLTFEINEMCAVTVFIAIVAAISADCSSAEKAEAIPFNTTLQDSNVKFAVAVITDLIKKDDDSLHDIKATHLLSASRIQDSGNQATFTYKIIAVAQPFYRFFLCDISVTARSQSAATERHVNGNPNCEEQIVVK